MRNPRRVMAFAAAVCGGVVFLGIAGLSSSAFGQRADSGPMLIAETDLTCSFYIRETPPNIRIASAVRAGEKTGLTEGDLFYADRASESEPFREDGLWSVVEWGPRVRAQSFSGTLGNAAFPRGLARVVRVENGRAVMKIEKACGPIVAGFYLLPFEAGSVLRGPELEYDLSFQGGETLTGRIVFLESDFVQIARGHWALIDIGAERGLEAGRQLTVFHREGNTPPLAIGNVIVIRTGTRWATVKILASKDPIRAGDLVQVK
jgi:hypothetical protein